MEEFQRKSLSASSLRDYLRNPTSLRAAKKQEWSGFFLVKGSSVHVGLETLNHARYENRLITLQEVLDAYDAAFKEKSKGVSAWYRPQQEEHFLGREQLTSLVHHTKDWKPILPPEFRFEFPLGYSDFQVVGYFDLVLEDRVVDFKTGKNSVYIRESLQPFVYALATRKIFGRVFPLFTFLRIDDEGIEEIDIEITDEDADWAQDVLIGAATDIRLREDLRVFEEDTWNFSTRESSLLF